MRVDESVEVQHVTPDPGNSAPEPGAGAGGSSAPPARPPRPGVARVCAAVAALLGGLVLVGWALGIEVLRSPLPGEVSMKPNTALSFLLLGPALLLLLVGRAERRLRAAGRLLALAPVIVSLLTLAEYAFDRDLGIDELLFRDTTAAVATVVPGRPAPLTAVCFLLLGSALLVLDRRRGAGLAQVLGSVAGFVGLLGLLPYLYGLRSSSGLIARETQMAMHTAVAMVLLGVGVVLARPDRGPMAFVGSDTIGGSLARRLLPVAVGLPVAAGWLAVGGQRLGLYDPGFRVSVVATASAAVLAVLTWVGTRSAHRSDLARRQAERTRVDLFRANPSAGWVTRMSDGLFVDVNEAFAQTFGRAREDLIGRTSVELNIWADLGEREAVMRMLREQGTVEGMEAHLRDTNGRSFPALFAARVEEIDGEPHVVGSLLDISERRRADEERERSARRLEGLNAIGRDILGARSTEEVTRVGLARLRELVPCMRASLARFDPATQELVILALDAEGETEVGIGARFPLTAAGPTDRLRRGEINRIPDTLEVRDPSPSVRRLIEEGVRMYANVPMVAAGELIGTINLSSATPGGFAEEELDATREVADLLTVALVESDLRDELRRHAEDLEQRVAERTAALSESETRCRSLLANAPDGVLLVDPAGVIALANDTAATLFGYEVIELHGLPVEVLVPESLWATHGRHREEYSTEHVARPMGTGLALRGRRKDGTEFPADISLNSILPDNAHGGPSAIAFVRDVTERERIEEAIVAAKEEAERANRAKDEFLSRMSHELRTPLNAVLGFAQVLEMEDLPPEQHDSVRQIRMGGQHLLELINEVLDISRVATGDLSLSLEPVGVSETLRDVVDLAQPLAADRGITLRLEDASGLHVLADRQRLKQVLFNLLSNAIKYNREGGSVDVSWAEAPEGKLRIHVTDTGPGIPPERMGQVFVSFDRLGAEAGGVEGTGLGLSLSKALAEGMGGTLEVKSEVGAGSVFTVELPLAEPPDQRYEREPREHDRMEERGQARTVLYVEDDLSNLRLIERILDRRPGVRLLTAMQGRLGIELARKHKPDLILLDLHLPDIGGEEALRWLRGDPATAGIPVVVISADATQAQIETLLAAGAREFVTKPIDVKRFLQVVDDVLRGPEDG